MIKECLQLIRKSHQIQTRRNMTRPFILLNNFIPVMEEAEIEH